MLNYKNKILILFFIIFNSGYGTTIKNDDLNDLFDDECDKFQVIISEEKKRESSDFYLFMSDITLQKIVSFGCIVYIYLYNEYMNPGFFRIKNLLNKYRQHIKYV